MFIFKILAFLLPTSSVDVIVRQLGVLAKRLAAAEAEQQAKVRNIDNHIASLQEARRAAEAQADHAGRVAGKINGLIN